MEGDTLQNTNKVGGNKLTNRGESHKKAKKKNKEKLKEEFNSPNIGMQVIRDISTQS